MLNTFSAKPIVTLKLELKYQLSLKKIVGWVKGFTSNDTSFRSVCMSSLKTTSIYKLSGKPWYAQFTITSSHKIPHSKVREPVAGVTNTEGMELKKEKKLL